MISIKKVKNLYNKKILLRLDLNVPLNNGTIVDTTRIDKILPTLNFLIKQNSKIIILSHIGRPKGKIVDELSLKPIKEDLQQKLKLKVKLIEENIFKIKNKDFFNDFDEQILIISQIRDHSSSWFIISDPGRVEQPPISIIETPSSIIFSILIVAFSSVLYFPPS